MAPRLRHTRRNTTSVTSSRGARTTGYSEYKRRRRSCDEVTPKRGATSSAGGWGPGTIPAMSGSSPGAPVGRLSSILPPLLALFGLGALVFLAIALLLTLLNARIAHQPPRRVHATGLQAVRGRHVGCTAISDCVVVRAADKR